MSSTANQTNVRIDEIVHLIKEGQQKLKDHLGLENGILVLGNPGSDKNIFTQWITNNDRTLRSRKDPSDESQYIIIDTAQRNASEPIFDAMFPQFKIGKVDQKNTTFYYFPSTDRSLGLAHDIALTYFIKKVVQNIKKVKIIFLLSHASLLKGAPWEDLNDIMATSMPLIRNFQKFKSGILLVLTKVRVDKNMADANVISSASNFLKIARQHFEVEVNQRNFSSYVRSLQFLDIILRKHGDVYPYIHLFRSPQEEHRVSEIPTLRTNRRNILAGLSKLSDVQTEEADFEYFIPVLSLDNVRSLLEEIHQHISASIKTFGQQVQKYLFNKENELYDIQKLRNETTIVYDKLAELKTIANQQNETETCVQKLFNSTILTNDGTGHESLTHAMEYANYSSFLFSVSGYSMDSYKCGNELNDTVIHADKTRKWYKFLDDLYSNSLSTYVVQKNTTESRCNDLAELVIKTHDQNVSQSSNVLEQVVMKCDPENEYDYKDTVMDKPKLNTLFNLLNLTMNHKVDFSCNSSNLLIEGPFVKLSDINELGKNCPITVRFIQVLAVHKLFFDEDIEKIGQIQLFVLAETWDVQSIRKIDLHGRQGEPFGQTKAIDGKKPGENGTRGLPGLPGSPGGHFFGLGGHFISNAPLVILSIGGTGGPGQHGGDGAEGDSGKNAINDLNENEPFPKISPGHKVLFSNATNQTCDDSRPCEEMYILQGKEGEPGGDGGGGGVGGLGGRPGTVSFTSVFYSGALQFQYETLNGSRGSGGAGGVGAKGGLYGRNLQINIRNPSRDLPTRVIDSKVLNNTLDEGARGSNGFSDINADNITNPVQSDPFANEMKTTIVKKYRALLREDMYHSVREFKLKEFHDSFDDNGNIFTTTTWNPASPTTPLDNDSTPTGDHTVDPHSTTNTQGTNDSDCTPIPTSDPKISAANNLNSPINTAVKWITDFFIPLKFIYPTLVTNYQSVKTGIRSMPSNQSNAYSINTKIGEFNINGAIALTDFLIRYVTKMKPYDNTGKPTNLSEVRAATLYIISEFQIVLSHLMRKSNLRDPFLEFDPVSLISKLDKKLINRDYQNLAQILFQSIDNNTHLDYAIFENGIQLKIDQILGIQSEESASVLIKKTK